MQDREEGGASPSWEAELQEEGALEVGGAGTSVEVAGEGEGLDEAGAHQACRLEQEGQSLVASGEMTEAYEAVEQRGERSGYTEDDRGVQDQHYHQLYYQLCTL